MLHIRSWCHKNLFRTTAILVTSIAAIIVVTSDTRHVTSYMRNSRPVPRNERTAVRVQALRPIISGIPDEESPPVAPRSGRNEEYGVQLPSDVQDDAADLGGNDAPVPPSQVSQPAATRLCTQTERMRIFRRECDKLNLSQSNYNKTLPLLGKLHVDDDHQVIMRDFAKAGSSTWLAILIRASKKFDNKSSKVGVVHSTGRLAKFGIRPLLSYKREEALYRLNNYFKFIVVRHPFDRLVSAWRDKFIMDNGPFTGRGRIIAHMYKREPFTNSTDEKYWKNKAFFREWATYVVDKNAKNEHWNPFWWRHPCTVQWDAIVKLETVKRDAVEVFKRLEFKDDLPVYHSHQERSELYQLDKSLPGFKGILPRALNAFNQKWEPDMSIFGYSWDQKALTAKCGATVDDKGNDMCC